jgi:hypothetical protein
MQRTTIKGALLALMLSSMVPLAACGDDDNDTQSGPTVTTPTSPTTSAPAPEPTPMPTPTPPSETPTTSVSGMVANLDRSGAGDLDLDFRIDSFTIVRAAAGTPVISGGQTFNTDAVRNGQMVTVEGKRTSGDSRGDFLVASKITINSQTP